MASVTRGTRSSSDRHEIPEVLLDPHGNTPLLVFDVMVSDLPRLGSDWQPPMHLTRKEREIVDHEGIVTILGRSGTGKTLCMAMRMLKDSERAAAGKVEDFRQIFVARSAKLTRQVKRFVELGTQEHNTTSMNDAGIGSAADMEASTVADLSIAVCHNWNFF